MFVQLQLLFEIGKIFILLLSLLGLQNKEIELANEIQIRRYKLMRNNNLNCRRLKGGQLKGGFTFDIGCLQFVYEG